MDGRQTVPRAEMTAVIRALMAIKQFGLGVTHATIWSDSKIVVNHHHPHHRHRHEATSCKAHKSSFPS
eukprot:6387833-Karenia_brevis.AAC.1